MPVAPLIALYVAAMTAANLLVWWLGPWVSPVLSFVLIGLDLTLRDVMHDLLSRLGMFAVILAGASVTLICNPAASQIAVASATAFGCSALADYATYALLNRRPWFVRANGSNLVGAAVDSVIFPTLAFGALMPAIIALQFSAKVLGGAFWALVLSRVVHEKHV